jgi:hypothetical protein
MNHHTTFHWRKQLIWGLMLIAFGSLVLLDRAGLVDFDVDLASIWHFWPWLLAGIGVVQLIPPTTARYVVNGLWKIFFAAWWYVSFEHVWGLDFHDTWPALIVAWGAGMVLRPLLHNYISSNKELV